MKSNELLRKAVQIALASGVAAAFAAPSVFAQDQNQDQEGDDEDARELDRVQVTGSRIKRTDLEGALPVTTIDREDIELSGESNAADLIRNLPFNSTGSFRPQSGSSAQNVSEVSLRGLGASRTLVLINGRRMPKSPLTGSGNDLNVIPLGAIERIEVLSDGASAVYGSDAIGGVINVILRDDFEGAEIMLGTQDVDPEGGDRTEGHAVFGASGPSGKIIAGASWNDRDIIFARDFDWYAPGASVFSNNYTTIGSAVDPSTGNVVTFDNQDFTDLPGACDSLGEAWYNFPNPQAAEGGERCAYNFALVSADEASIGNRSAFVRAEHWINDDWSLFMDINVNKTESFGRYAPVPDGTYYSDNSLDGVPVTTSSPNNPTNPSGYFGNQTGLAPQPVNIWHRFDALGNRDNESNTELADLLVGANGYIGSAEVEVGVRNTSNKVYDIGRNYLMRSTAFDYIENGAYNLADPYGDNYSSWAPNPSVEHQSILNAMKVTTSRVAQYDQKEAFGSVAFDAGALPAGPISWFVGAEYREEMYDDQYDSLSEAGEVGGSSGNSAGLDRDVSAVYFEGLMPLLDSVELNVAGRYEDYSDYGDDFAPKLSVRWDAMDDLVVRASIGQGYRAPTLPVLSQQTAYSADSVVDPDTCTVLTGDPGCNGSSVQINAYRIANPDLSSEQSDQFSMGAAWAPTDWFNGSLDYWNIEISERIAFFSSQGLINREQAGDPIPAGLGITRAPNGSITRIDTGYGNEGTVVTDGLDLNLQANTDLLGGRFSSELQMSYLLSQEVDEGRNQTGDPGIPRQRATLANTYSVGDFSVAYNINWIGEQCDDMIEVTYQNDPACDGKVPSWVTNDLQFNYFTPWDSRITLGAQNLGNKQPPIGKGDFGSRAYDFELYNGYGRIVYARFTQTF